MNAEQAKELAKRHKAPKTAHNARKVYAKVQRRSERGGRSVLALISCGTRARLVADGFKVTGCGLVLVRW
jgi:hypothetical protein